MAWACKTWGALPEAGGLLDQPAGLMKKMAHVSYTYDVIKGRTRAKDVIAWIDADPARYDYYTWLKELMANNGD
jgi:hypothetical protein